MAGKKKRKPKWKWLRYRKGDLAHNFMVAAQRYIHGNGGTATILGPIQIIQMPGDNPAKFSLAMGCLGQRPTKPVKEK